MTRRLGLAVAALAALVALAVATVGAGPGAKTYRVDAIFDNADFLIAGQDLKVGGARAGRVRAVRLTRDRRARVELEVDEGFAPFRADADCSIRPQSLIGEKFVQCDPGTPDAPPLAERDGHPTVPLSRTHSPVDLDLVFAALRRPLRERLTLLVNELGTGLAGRPRELNDAIRRANPALQQANRTLSILDRERDTLGRLVDTSDRVLEDLAERRGEVRDFIASANDVTRTAAERRDDLDRALRLLPPTLAELEPSATELSGLAAEARPVLRDLRGAAPQVRALLGDFDPLADATRPTLRRLSELSRTGLEAIRAADPVADLLRPVADRLPPNVALVRELTDSIEDQDVGENIARYTYFAAASVARFDRYSHILPSYQLAGPCQVWANEPLLPQCDAHYAGYRGPRAPELTPAARRSAKRTQRAESVPFATAPERGAGAAGGERSAPRKLQDQALDYLLGP